MTFKTMILVAAFAAAGGSAFAQNHPPHHMPAPEMQAARTAMRQACAADAQSLCKDQTGHPMMMCMRQNMEKVSQPCKDAIAKMPHRQRPMEKPAQ